MSRLDAVFAGLRAGHGNGLVTYVTAGDPDMERSGDILATLDEAGAAVIEVGVPFSDPIADGPVIQRAASRAIARGTTLAGVLRLVAGARSRLRAPVVLFSYANPILRFGIDRFARVAADAGVDGTLVLDLPLDEAGAFRDTMAGAGLDQIFLVSPTTSGERIRMMSALGSGFLYAISRLGVTGSRDELAEGGRALVERIRSESALPIAVGFGISHPDHVREVRRWADAAVVGSSLVSVIEREGRSPGLLPAVHQHVQWLLGGPPWGADARSAGSRPWNAEARSARATGAS
jgi:tryptophan synthase alpha chain